MEVIFSNSFSSDNASKITGIQLSPIAARDCGEGLFRNVVTREEEVCEVLLSATARGVNDRICEEFSRFILEVTTWSFSGTSSLSSARIIKYLY